MILVRLKLRPKVGPPLPQPRTIPAMTHFSSRRLMLGAASASLLACSAGGSTGSTVTDTESDFFGSTGGSSSLAGNGSGPPLAGGLPDPTSGGFGIGPEGNETIAERSCFDNCQDFPSAPLLEAGTPANAAELFGGTTDMTGTPPCVLEPQLSTGSSPGSMIPANWLRPRFLFEPAGDEDLFEIRVASPFQANDLVAYTTRTEWLIPRDIWLAARANVSGDALSVRIRGINRSRGGTPSGVEGDFEVAPVNAGGSMVFWATTSAEVTPDSSLLRGFRVGDEGVVDSVVPALLDARNRLHEQGRDLRGEFGTVVAGFEPGQVRCVGCHTSTPDGDAVVFTDDYPWGKVIANVTEEGLGSAPGYVSSGAQTMLQMPWLGTQTMSPAHWTSGDRILVGGFAERQMPFANASSGNNRLAWFDLETALEVSAEVPPNTVTTGPTRNEMQEQRNALLAQAQGNAWDVLATNGESRHAVTPAFSNDGTTIAYVSTDLAPNGHPAYEARIADIMLVPYADRQGGSVTPLSGAASPDFLEYYPEFSADDRLVAFTRAPNAGGQSPDGPYYNRNGEIYVVAPSGGNPIRLSANDPVACGGEVSPGVHNSWPKWSPEVGVADGKRYYFVVFSSSRAYPGTFDLPRAQYTPQSLSSRSSQLYMAAIVVDEATGQVVTYPATYLWNQNDLIVGEEVTTVAASNLTPAWDAFNIPPVPVPTIIR